MKSLGSGNYGSKFFKELALDYGLPHRADLLSKLGIRSKHSRLLYAVGMLALACFLILAIWATGSSMHAPEDSDNRLGQHIRKFGYPPGPAAEAAAPTDPASGLGKQQTSKAADTTAGNTAGSSSATKSSQDKQAAGSAPQQGQGSNSTAAEPSDSKSANAADHASGRNGTPAAVSQAAHQQQQQEQPQQQLQAALSPAAAAKQGEGNPATAMTAAASVNTTAEGH